MIRGRYVVSHLVRAMGEYGELAGQPIIAHLAETCAH